MISTKEPILEWSILRFPRFEKRWRTKFIQVRHIACTKFTKGFILISILLVLEGIHGFYFGIIAGADGVSSCLYHNLPLQLFNLCIFHNWLSALLDCSKLKELVETNTSYQDFKGSFRIQLELCRGSFSITLTGVE